MGLIPLAGGFLLDKILGDPLWLPHPVVGFGKLISRCERRGNQGAHRRRNGAWTAIGLVVLTFLVSKGVLEAAALLHPWVKIALSVVAVFYCLAGKTLIDEVRMVFEAADTSLEAGRKQVARIVGRDTSALTGQEVRTAALETLAENLSDGVIAPLFWYFLLGVPGMLAYKMVNTLDSMIGYRNARYKDFGCWAARMDDVANYLPARLTSLLMILVSGRWSLLKFVAHYGRMHASPNSGYPEAALAGIAAQEAFFRSIGMPVRIPALSCGRQDEAGLADLASRCSYGRTRTIGTFRVLGYDDILAIYQLANNEE